MELEPNPPRDYKDRLFKAIYGRDSEESKRWRLELYNALNGTDYKDPDALELNTIENFLFITMKNDVSFLIDSQMNLYEQQSTFNPNMPLRGLFYFSLMYMAHLNANDIDLYGTALVKIPTPKFLVLYNGEKNMPDVTKFRLSDAFIKPDKDGAGDFEWTATMLNINKGSNEALHKKCESLYHYSSYVAKIRENLAAGMSLLGAVTQAVDFAIDNNYLDGFFKREKGKIIMFSMSEFDQEAYDRHRRREGYEEGAQQKAVEDAKKLLADGKYTAEEISGLLGIPVEAFSEPAPAQA